VNIGIIASRAALASIDGEWQALWRACPDATPFQSPAWLLPWWDAFHPGSLLVIACRRGGELAGLCPLFMPERQEGAPREVLLLGTGNTDYLDALVRPGEPPETADAMLATIASAAAFDVCDLRCLRPCSPLLTAKTPESCRDERHEELPCPVLALDGSRVVDRPLPPGLAHDIRYGTRRAEREGGLTFERAASHTLAGHLDVLFQIHASRWQARGEPGVLHDETTQAFHRAAAQRLHRDGCLRLLTLSIGGRPAAVIYGFVHGRRAYYYIGAFAPAFSKLHAGKLAIDAAIRDAISENVLEFDFLAGAEPYKYEWGARDRPRMRRRIIGTRQRLFA
jgi:CelD/BcsL family acetyltransferase involved in cellulose biosynthesis